MAGTQYEWMTSCVRNSKVDILTDIGVQLVAAVDDNRLAFGVEPAGLVIVRPGVTRAGHPDDGFFAVDHVDGGFGLGVLIPDVKADHGQVDDDQRRDDRPHQLQQGIAVIRGAIAAVVIARAEEDNRDQEHALDQEEDHAADDHQDVEEFVDALGFRRGLRRQHPRHKGREPIDADDAHQQKDGGDDHRGRAYRRDVGAVIFHTGSPPAFHNRDLVKFLQMLTICCCSRTTRKPQLSLRERVCSICHNSSEWALLFQADVCRIQSDPAPTLQASWQSGNGLICNSSA